MKIVYPILVDHSNQLNKLKEITSKQTEQLKDNKTRISAFETIIKKISSMSQLLAEVHSMLKNRS